MTIPAEFTNFVAICSGIAVIIACIKLVNTPFEQIKKNKEDIQKMKSDNSDRKEMDRAILHSLQAITNHMIDGNGIDKLRASRDELARTIADIATK